MHDIQLRIIKALVFDKQIKFSQLKTDLKNIDNNQLCFHLNSLQKQNLVKKDENNIYSLTTEGLSLSEKLDTESMKLKQQAKLTVYLGVVNNNDEILIYTRKKSPFYDCQGFGGGRIEYGENILDAAKRELKEETGLEGEPQLIKILHNKIYSKETKELLVDKILFFCKIINPTGILASTEEGIYEWVKIENVSKYITKPFDSKEEFLKQVKYLVNWNGNISLEEQSEEVEDY